MKILIEHFEEEIKSLEKEQRSLKDCPDKIKRLQAKKDTFEYVILIIKEWYEFGLKAIDKEIEKKTISSQEYIRVGIIDKGEILSAIVIGLKEAKEILTGGKR